MIDPGPVARFATMPAGRGTDLLGAGMRVPRNLYAGTRNGKETSARPRSR